MFTVYKNLFLCIFRKNKSMRRVQGRLCERPDCRWGQFELQSLTLGARLSDPPLHQTLFTKLLIFLDLALTCGWLDFHPPSWDRWLEIQPAPSEMPVQWMDFHPVVGVPSILDGFPTACVGVQPLGLVGLDVVVDR